MEKKKTKNESGEKQSRKGRPGTGLTQKHVAFRMDLDLIDFYRAHQNSGRWLNDLIRRAKDTEGWPEDCADMPPEPDEDLS